MNLEEVLNFRRSVRRYDKITDRPGKGETLILNWLRWLPIVPICNCGNFIK